MVAPGRVEHDQVIGVRFGLGQARSSRPTRGPREPAESHSQAPSAGSSGRGVAAVEHREDPDRVPRVLQPPPAPRDPLGGERRGRGERQDQTDSAHDVEIPEGRRSMIGRDGEAGRRPTGVRAATRESRRRRRPALARTVSAARWSAIRPGSSAHRQSSGRPRSAMASPTRKRSARPIRTSILVQARAIAGRRRSPGRSSRRRGPGRPGRRSRPGPG